MLKVLENKDQFREFVQSVAGAGKCAKLVHFSAPWAAACAQMDNLLAELQRENGIEAAKVVSESQPELSLQYKVTAVPAVCVFQDGKLLAKVEGFHPSQLKDLVAKASFEAAISPHAETVTETNSAAADEAQMKETLDDRLKRLINSARLTLFMKGSPDAPRCGFSRQIVDLFCKHNLDFWTFDILNDEEVRQGLKIYSDWPTYPQVYLDGELLGGLDVIREELNDPKFVEKLPKKP